MPSRRSEDVILEAVAELGEILQHLHQSTFGGTSASRTCAGAENHAQNAPNHPENPQSPTSPFSGNNDELQGYKYDAQPPRRCCGPGCPREPAKSTEAHKEGQRERIMSADVELGDHRRRKKIETWFWAYGLVGSCFENRILAGRSRGLAVLLTEELLDAVATLRAVHLLRLSSFQGFQGFRAKVLLALKLGDPGETTPQDPYSLEAWKPP